MGQGNSGGAIHHHPGGGLSRYRVVALFVLTAFFVAVKVVARDFWAVGFGLAVLAIVLLTPESPERREPWRAHALRVVSACFVVVTLATIVTTLSGKP
jgi:uncharacterized membrane protein YccC